jgi:dihydroneopterin aldolase
MDKIIMKNMQFFGRHGVLPEEKTLGQKFFVDAELYLDLLDAGETDKLQYTVDYGAVYAMIRDIMEKESYNLIEAAAETICSDVLFALKRFVKSRGREKTEAPYLDLDHFAVELTRERDA